MRETQKEGRILCNCLTETVNAFRAWTFLVAYFPNGVVHFLGLEFRGGQGLRGF
jgi:hypothetical protein